LAGFLAGKILLLLFRSLVAEGLSVTNDSATDCTLVLTVLGFDPRMDDWDFEASIFLE
jgi:hypothetical protein